MEISKSSIIPAYFQVAEAIGFKIKSGELKTGSMIPSESQLCKEYNVSRMTVRRGLAILTQAGYLTTSKGKGTFVSRPKFEELVVNFPLKEKVNAKLLSAEIISLADEFEGIHEKLNLKKGSKAILIRRLFMHEKEPISYDKKYLLYIKGKPVLETDLEYAELPEMAEKHADVLPVKSELLITATTLQGEDALLLESKKGEAALVVEQTVYAQDSTPIGWGQTICRAEKYSLRAVSQPF